MQVTDRIHVGGTWQRPHGSETSDLVDPFTEEVYATVAMGDEADVDAAVRAAGEALRGPWGETTPRERAEVLARIAEGLADRAMEIASVITRENGTPLAGGRQGLVAVGPFEYYAEYGRTHTFEELRESDLGRLVVRREPVGVVGAILPWNVPLGLTAMKLAPALLAGCTFVLKPSPETPLDAFILAEVLENAGVPDGVFSVIPGGARVGEHLVRHPGVDKIAFTGSTEVGRRIASICGEQMKRVTLELGGKSAAIVLDDADLEKTIGALVPHGSMMYNGQACILQSRILVSGTRYDEVVEARADAVGSLRVGDPYEESTQVGPLVSARQRDRVQGYIDTGHAEGARAVVGGGRSRHQKGWFVEPTVFADVENSMTVAREEIFGPVLSVIRYRDEQDAVDIANDTVYGLSGTVFTEDIDRGVAVAAQVRTGMIGVNAMPAGVGLPFGGMKASGIGREGGPEGLAAYTEYQALGVPVGYDYVLD
jgi:aldehyde dehydrogenase (NAD+)